MRSRLGPPCLPSAPSLSRFVVAQAQNPVSNGIRPWRSARRRTSWTPRRRCRPTSNGYKPTPAQMSYGDVVAHLIKEGKQLSLQRGVRMKQPDVTSSRGRPEGQARGRPQGLVQVLRDPRWLRSKTRS